MDWQIRLRREGIHRENGDHSHVYHPTVRPAIPDEYAVPGMVGLTFRLAERADGGHVYVTSLDLGAVARMGARMGLDPGEALAMVDAHERVHIALQLAGVSYEEEEDKAMFVDAVVLSFRHPDIAEHLEAGEFGVVTRVKPGFWEALVDLRARDAEARHGMSASQP